MFKSKSCIITLITCLAASLSFAANNSNPIQVVSPDDFKKMVNSKAQKTQEDLAAQAGKMLAPKQNMPSMPPAPPSTIYSAPRSAAPAQTWTGPSPTPTAKGTGTPTTTPPSSTTTNQSTYRIPASPGQAPQQNNSGIYTGFQLQGGSSGTPNSPAAGQGQQNSQRWNIKY